MSSETIGASAGWQTLDPRKIQLDRAGGFITTALLSSGYVIGAGIFALTGDDVPLWIRLGVLALWPVVTIGLAVASYFWPPVEHRYARYRIDDELIEIQRGVVWRVSITVPRSRVQHLDVTQGPLQRRFGLGALVIYTAGTEHSQVTLDGLAFEVAQVLRDRLLPRDAQVDGV